MTSMNADSAIDLFEKATGQTGDTSVVTDEQEDFVPKTNEEQPKEEKPVVTVDDGIKPSDVTDTNTFNPVVYYKEKLGYTGDVDGSDIDDLIKIHNEVVAPLQQQLNDPAYLAFKEHVKEGGNAESFTALQNIDRTFRDIKVDEDNVEQQEAIALTIATSLNGMAEDKAKVFVQSLKDAGALNDFNGSGLTRLQSLEQQEEDDYKQSIKDKIDADKRENEKYFGNIEKIGKERAVNGLITMDYWEDVVKMSVPNDKGQLESEVYLDKISDSPEMILIMNALAFALVNKKAFNYNPAVTRSGTSTKTADLFNRSSKPTNNANASPISELESYVNSKIKQ